MSFLNLKSNPKMKAVTRFVFTAFALFICWYAFHDFYLIKHTYFVQDLIIFETNTTSKFLNLITEGDTFSNASHLILHNGRRTLRVGNDCNALVLFALFSGFIIAYPGNWRTKLWYIPVGILIIFAINIIRMALLTLNFLHFRSSFAFNHHVTFTYTVYAFIFLLWMVWVNKLSRPQHS
jgi:exosortase family protein XrtF